MKNFQEELNYIVKQASRAIEKALYDLECLCVDMEREDQDVAAHLVEQLIEDLVTAQDRCIAPELPDVITEE